MDLWYGMRTCNREVGEGLVGATTLLVWARKANPCPWRDELLL